MELRRCKGCGLSFRVMATSKQSHHSAECEKTKGNLWGNQNKDRMLNLPKRCIQVSLSDIKPTPPFEKPIYKDSSASGKLSKKSTENLAILSRESETQKNSENKSDSENDDSEKEKQMTSTDINEKIITPAEVTTQESNEKDDTHENHLAIYEPPLEILKQEFLTSSSILTESAKQLHELNKKLLKIEEFKGPSITDMEMARQNAAIIAQLVQTKINFVKVLRS